MTEINQIYKVAVITGGSSGIGAAMASLLHRQGFDVCIIARNLQNLNIIKKKFADRMHVYQGDVSDSSKVDYLFKTIMQRFSKIDLIVHAAGCAYFKSTVLAGNEEINNLFRINTFGTLNVLKAVANYCCVHANTTVVNISTLASVSGFPQQSIYCASKSAANRIFESFLLENSDIQGCNVYLGRTETGIESRLLGDSNAPQLPGGARFRSGMNTEDVAKEIYKGYLTKKSLVIPGIINKAFFILAKLSPSLVGKLLSKTTGPTSRISPTEKGQT